MKKIEIEEYKEIVLSILVKIDQICRENNLTYMLGYGTLLGAIRHKGFIPWDDDADIIMPRKDYCKLQEIIRTGNYGLNFISIDTEPNTIYPFGKVCDIRTVMYEKNFKNVPGYGAFVDVFPFDYIPDDNEKRQKYFKKYNKIVKIITHGSRTGYENSKSKFVNLQRFTAFYLSKMFNVGSMIKKMEDEFIEFNKVPTNYMGVPWDRGAFPVDYVMKVQDCEFEGYRFLIPSAVDSILTEMYGDYMKLPPINEQVNKHQLECYYKEERFRK